MDYSHYTAIEATVLRPPLKPRHHFWAVFHDWHSPYIVVDLQDDFPTGIREGRIPLLPRSGIQTHPRGSAGHLYREEPYRRLEAQWVSVAQARPSEDYSERIAPEAFHRDPQVVETMYWSDDDDPTRRESL